MCIHSECLYMYVECFGSAVARHIWNRVYVINEVINLWNYNICSHDFIPDLMTLACTSSFCFRNLCTFLSSLCDFVSPTRFYGTLKLPRTHTQHTRKNAAVQNWNISKKIAFVHLFKSFCCKIKKTLRFAILTSLDWLHTHWKFLVWVAHSWFAIEMTPILILAPECIDKSTLDSQ